ncbi:uncharacterized protein NPIL_473591 [Nephila pilipes]|uniref:Uncharacterized protein n=1 Tax=Nephila pilipes TaxID=299642 RepID=A0A8X6N1K9_NEPPI|nr:uncharacterized protein NPIL_473591 [Nephila pilipes]
MNPPKMLEFDKYIIKKSKELDKLNAEYEKLLASSAPMSDTDSEIKILNSELCKLKAEICVLKTNKPEIMPNCDSFLYSWAVHTLKEDIKGMEKGLTNLDSIHRESIKRKELLTKMYHDMCNTMDERMLEHERCKNELLHCLHRKLVRRLRRLSRLFPTYSTRSKKMNTSIRNKSGEILTKSFYRVLKEFVVELQDRTFTSEDWHQIKLVPIDHTYRREHIKLLCDCGIIQRASENSPIFHLRTS